jgi:nucleoporin NUP2
LGNNPHDEEGEGEEQEDTVYSVKLRAFRLKKAEEKGGSGWAELGYGMCARF